MPRPKNRGIPTMHKGRRFRSRLEARWASFFDLAGWPYEYEPFDLDGWVPDFLITGTHPVLVEVKPTYVIPTFNFDKVLGSGATSEILMLGCTIPVRPVDDGESFSPFGWLVSPEGGPTDALLLDYEDRIAAPHPRFGFSGKRGPRPDRLTGFDPSPESWCVADPYRVLSLWADAGNKTQWMGAR